MAKKPTAPLTALPNSSDQQHALLLFAETLAEPHNTMLAQQRLVEFNLPLFGWQDMYVALDEGQPMLAFSAAQMPGLMMDASACKAMAGFFARMGDLLQERGK